MADKPPILPAWQPPAPSPGGLGERITNGLVWVVSQVWANLATPILNVITNALYDGVELIISPISDPVKRYYASLAATPGLPEEYRAVFESMAAANSPVHLVGGAMMLVSAVAGMAMGSLAPFARLGQYRIDTTAVSNRLTPAEAYRALFAGAFPADRVVSTLSDLGYDTAEQGALAFLARNWPTVTEIREQMYREIITQEDAKEQLKTIGFDPIQADRLLAIFPILPGVQDMVRFAVREVFSPEIRQQYGMDQDFPADFADQAKKLGLDPTWAAAYWAAHWDLPSITAGYEMFHRIDRQTGDSLISQADLETLLRTQDVLPFWRDKLIKIAYSPFTRVDVRRMYTAGVIDEREVYNTYRDLGYDDFRAKKLMEFTVKDKQAPRRDLSLADLQDAYKRGVFTREQTLGYIQALGFDPDEAEFYTGRTDWLAEKERIDDEIGLIEQQYKRGTLSETDARSKLAGLDLTALQIDYNILRWTRIVTQKTRTPSVTELQGFLRAGSVSEGEFREELDKMGFEAKYIEMYLREIHPELTVSQLLAQYRESVITPDEFRQQMGAKGYTAEQIADFELQLVPEPTLSQAQQFFRKGAWGEGQFRAYLASKKYSPQYIDAYVVISAPKVTPTEAAKIARATISQLGQFLRESIISEVQYRDELKLRNYQPVDIDRLTRLNLPVTAVEPVRVTIGQLSTFFREGAINESQYRTRLLGLGYDSADIDSFIAVNKPGPVVGVPEPTLANYSQWLRLGVIDETTYRARLTAIGYTATDINRFVEANRPEAPTVTAQQLSTFFRQGVIDEGTYVDRMQQIGYSPGDTDLFVALNTPDVEVPVRFATVPNLNQWYQLGIIDTNIYKAYLAKLGFEAVDIDRFVAANAPGEE